MRLAKLKEFFRRSLMVLAPLLGGVPEPSAAVNVLLTGVPDYTWYAGCFGTASGNLMGYWDRHGMSGFYTGPTAGGLAPLNNFGVNEGIRSLWATKAGVDGRPLDQPGHIDDYWESYHNDFFYSYESSRPDPYRLAGRPEHPPDCIGDFIGLSQNKWKNLNDECDGNIDAFSFVFWDKSGALRWNFVPQDPLGRLIPDIPSGLRRWARWRGYESDVFSQLSDFNPEAPPGQGFTFENFKAEIDAGYPVLLFLQSPQETFRPFPEMERGNPHIHGMLAYGYMITEDGRRLVRYRDSWGGGDNRLRQWDGRDWEAQLPVRGWIGFRPKPKITRVERVGGFIRLEWDGPSSTLSNAVERTSYDLHWYTVEKATSLSPPQFAEVSSARNERWIHLPDDGGNAAIYRVKLLAAPSLTTP